ncbi:MAG: 4Fe-4S binding protein [Actinomycetota bacterium]
MGHLRLMTLQEQDHSSRRERRQTFGLGLLKGMRVTLKHLFKHNTVIQYPDEKQDLSPRTRGVIALKEENCTVCMLCARECPDWCIYIDSHKETLPPKRQGGRPRKRNVLDRFAIDYALCMYCGICVEVCPYDALFWSREFEYAEYDIRELTHEKEKLSDWMATVLPPPQLEEGALLAGEPATAAGAAGPGSAQRPSSPSQATAAEERPQQAPRAPEAASASAPPEAKATEAQVAAGETLPSGTAARPDATEQKVETGVGEATAAETAEPTGAQGGQPEGLKSPGEQVPAESEPTPAAEPTAARPTPAEPTAAEPTPAEPGREDRAPGPPARPAASLGPAAGPEEAAALYRKVLQEQLDRGSSPQVAEARARVAKVKAERGIGAERLPPTAGAVGPERGIRAEAPPAGGAAGPESPVETRADERPQTEPEDPLGGAGEEPDAAYERVLAEERAKGSSDAVAIARAKAARVRASKGTKGPGG